MGFQREVRADMGVANPGDIVEAHGSHLLLQQMITEDDKCQVGGFVRAGTTATGCVNAAGSNEVIGIIVNDKFYDGSNEGVTLPKGTPVSVAVFGVIAVTNTYSASATFMDDVYVKESDGTLIFNSTGSADGATKTHWKVKQGCEPGEIAFVAR